jgi:hypothetical protein
MKIREQDTSHTWKKTGTVISPTIITIQEEEMQAEHG